MAGARNEKIGTIFTRIYGLLRTGAMHENERPLWYDVFAAFPPRIEPKFDRFVSDTKPVNILYHEDAIRAKFYQKFGSPDIIDMTRSTDTTLCDRFIAAYNDLKTRSPNLNEEQLFTSAADVLRSSGVTLRSLSNIQKEKLSAKKTATSS